jgi:hypothetical protein
MGIAEIDRGSCIICKKDFDRRVKGMKDRAYKKQSEVKDGK